MKSSKFIIVSSLLLQSLFLIWGSSVLAAPGGANFTVIGIGSPGAGPAGPNINIQSVGQPYSGPAGVNLIPMKQKMASVSLESLDAEYFPASRVVSVRGTLRNISGTALRGYITIFLSSQTGAVLAAYDMQVNDHRPFLDGETVPIDTEVNVSSVSGAFKVSVEFTKD